MHVVSTWMGLGKKIRGKYTYFGQDASLLSVYRNRGKCGGQLYSNTATEAPFGTAFQIGAYRFLKELIDKAIGMYVVAASATVLNFPICCNVVIVCNFCSLLSFEVVIAMDCLYR